MGIKESKCSVLTFEEACRRVDSKELQRIKDAFKKTSGNSGMMTKGSFINEVIGDIVPQKVAEQFFFACGGCNKGISLKEVVGGLVIISKSTLEEKFKFVFNMISKDGVLVTIEDIEYFIKLNGNNGLSETRKTNDIPVAMNETEFYAWLQTHKDFSPITKWLLIEQVSKNSVTLSCPDDTPSFFQTLSEITHLKDDEIVALEKRHGALLSSSKSGQLDVETLKQNLQPFISLEICKGIFRALDTNNDGHIDFKELVCGVSDCCKGTPDEEIAFCFRVFDENKDGFLSRTEVKTLVESFLPLTYSSKNTNNFDVSTKCHQFVEDILRFGDAELVNLADFSRWGSTSTELKSLILLISQICHIVFGLNPVSPKKEGTIVRKWIQIQEEQGLQQSQIYYLVAMSWWDSWKSYVSNEVSGKALLSPHTANRNHFTGTGEKPPRSPVRHYISNGMKRSHSSITPVSVTTSTSPTTNGKTTVTTNLQRPGPIDNSSLLVPETKKLQNLTGEGGSLKQTTILVRGRDFEILPEPVWHALFAWYGGNTPLPRTVIVPSEYDTEPTVELYPVQVYFYRHKPPQSKLPHLSLASFGITNLPLLNGGNNQSSNINQRPGVQSSLVIPKRTLMYRASFSRKNTLKQVHSYVCTRLNLKPEDVRLWDMSWEGHSFLLEEDQKTLEDLHIVTGKSLLIEVRNVDLSWPEEMNTLVASKNFRERSSTGPLVKGATGLHNLGNTCFMNSAVQCISNIQPLRHYFIQQRHLFELNKDNPLSSKGSIARRYGELMQDLWSGIFRSIAPVKLRWTIGKHAPRFIGFSQHDSQELLAFLLDGLHEDLNRVHKKPYVELKDSEGRTDKDVAHEAWENHLKRNQSVIVDLFHGQLKSQVRCLACGNCSVRFDPYTFLSLPLPMENSLHIEIVVFHASNKVPTKYGLLLGSECKIQKLREELANLTKTPPINLVLAEISSAMLHNFPKDTHKVRNLSSGYLVAYEVLFQPVTYSSFTKAENATAVGHPNFEETVVTGDSREMPSPANSTSGAVTTEEMLLRVSSRDNEDLIAKETLEDMDQLQDDDGLSSEPLVPRMLSTSTEAKQDNNNLGFVVVLHRKMIHRDSYFFSWQKFRPLLFGAPLVVPVLKGFRNRNLYEAIWSQVSRFVSTQGNEDSNNQKYPFTLKFVTENGSFCGVCPWYRFCRGCTISCDDQVFSRQALHISIDWDYKALHLYYQPSRERDFEEDSSVTEALAILHEPIDIDKCLKDFTKEEELGQDETWFCPKCKKQQSIAKKIDLWSLPPILVIHLKRFQQLNNRWVKSNKVVKFPMENFDPSTYLVKRRRTYHDSCTATRDGWPAGTLINCEEASILTKNIDLAGIDNIVEDLDAVKSEDDQNIEAHLPDFESCYYSLCALSCHTGMLNGGHYISYAKNPNNKWYCYNDSTCKEVDAAVVENESPYMLFYQRDGLNHAKYLPDITNKKMMTDPDDSKEFESDVKRGCILQ